MSQVCSASDNPTTKTNNLLRSYQSKREKARRIKFLSELFGLKYLGNYIGKTTFFARLPTMMASDPPGDMLSGRTAEEDGFLAQSLRLSCTSWMMRYSPLNGSRQSSVVQSDSRLDIVLPLLHGRCQSLFMVDGNNDVPHRHANETRKVEHELKSIWLTLGGDLLQHIMMTFSNVCREHEPS
ncbi:hypothetical protein EDD15DRAFT_2244270 [Pisolithus albus]|nr:hypothetical protein EDD15DRAFT_2244270 [Pisolithus albus]